MSAAVVQDPATYSPPTRPPQVMDVAWTFPVVCGGKVPATGGDWGAAARPGREHALRLLRQGSNIGIACGPSGLAVIDLDVKPGVNGAAEFEVLCQRTGMEYPEWAPLVTTPSGGCHLYFLNPGGKVRNSAGLLGPGIDVRGAGGYVVGPGSSTAAGRYDLQDRPLWERGLLAPFPEELIPLLRQRTVSVPAFTGPRPATPQALEGLLRTVAEAQAGNRNNTLNWSAWHWPEEMRDALGMSLLVDAARHAGLAEHEAERTIRSAWRRYP